jgi:hypothetical protein
MMRAESRQLTVFGAVSGGSPMVGASWLSVWYSLASPLDWRVQDEVRGDGGDLLEVQRGGHDRRVGRRLHARPGGTGCAVWSGSTT